MIKIKHTIALNKNHKIIIVTWISEGALCEDGLPSHQSGAFYIPQCVLPANLIKGDADVRDVDGKEL